METEPEDPTIPEPSPPILPADPTPRPKRSVAPKRRSAADSMSPPRITRTESKSGPAETRIEIEARIKRAEIEAEHCQSLAKITHFVFAGLLVLVTFVCLFVMAVPYAVYPSETRKLTSTLLTAIVSGGSAFFAGKAAGKAAS